MKKRGNISLEGYRKNSPDRFNDFNIIPSNEISMQNVNKNVLMIPMGGRGTGNPILAKPGERYFFPNHELVFEQAMPENAMMRYQRVAQFGGLHKAEDGYEMASKRLMNSFMPENSNVFAQSAPLQFPVRQNLPYNSSFNFPFPNSNRPGGMYFTEEELRTSPLNSGFQRPSSYKDYKPKFGWERSSMTDEEIAYEEEYNKNYYYPKHAGEKRPSPPAIINLPYFPDERSNMTFQEMVQEWARAEREATNPNNRRRGNPYMLFEQGGNLPKAQMYNSQVGVIPTLDNQFIYPSNFKYEQGTPVQNRAQTCQGPDCLAGANTYYNRYVASKFGLPDTWKMNEAYGIVSGDPNQPYGVSADSWDLAALMQDKGAIQNYAAPLYTNNVRNSEKEAEQYWNLITPEEKKKLYSQLALGSLVNFGDYGGLHGERLKGSNQKAGLYPSRHSTRVVGYTEDGIPMIYDMGQIRRIDDPKYDFPLTNITTPKELAKYNYEYVKDWQNKNQKKLDYNPKEKLLLGKKSIREGEDAFTQEENQYVEGINKNIKNLMQATGASQDDIIKAGKVAFGILEAETKGGRGSAKAKIKELTKAVINANTPFPSEASKGLTRIKPEMQAGDETNKYSQYMKTLGLNPKDLDLWDPEQAALATTALILSRKGDIEGVDKWYLRAQQHNTPSVGSKNEQRLKEADKDYANNVIRNASRIYSSKTGYGLPETEKWMNTKKAEKEKQEGEKIWSERFKPNIMSTESTGYIPNIPSMTQRAYGGLHKAQDGRIQAATTYPSGKEQNYMSPERRAYEQSLANQIAEKQLADAKLAMNIAGLAFYPASVAASAIDFSEGDYAQGFAGLIPFVGSAKKANTARNVLNQASRNLLTKSYNAGIPQKIAAPIIRSGKKGTIYGANAANVEDAYDAFSQHAYGGALLNKTLTCPSCGWSWKAVDGGTDITTCHKCGGTAKLKFGGGLDELDEEYRRGGALLNRRETNKNIKSSINNLMRRNETLFGPAGRNFYNPNPMKKYYKGGIAFPQAPTAGDTPGQQETEFYPPNWIPRGPVGFYEHGGIAYPQQPTSDYFFSGSPWMAHYDMGGGLPSGANNMYMPCMNCGGYMEDGGMYYAEPGMIINPNPPKATPVPAMNADLYENTVLAAKDQAYTQDLINKAKKQEEWNKAHPWTPSAGTTPGGGRLFHKTGQMGTPQDYFYNTKSGSYDLYTPPPVIAKQRYGGFQEGGFMSPNNMMDYPTFSQGGDPYGYEDGGNVLGLDQDQITRTLGQNFMSGVQGNMPGNLMREAVTQYVQNPYQMPEGEYGYNMNMHNMNMNMPNMINAGNMFAMQDQYNELKNKNKGALKNMYGAGMFALGTANQYTKYKAKKAGKGTLPGTPDMTTNPDIASNKGLNNVTTQSVQPDMTGADMTQTGMARYGAAYIPKAQAGFNARQMKAAGMPELTFSSPSSASTSANPNNLSPEALAKKQAFYDDSRAYDQKEAMYNQMQQAGYPNMMGAYPNMMGQQGQFAPNFQGMYDNFGNDDYRVGRMSRGMQNMLPYLMSNPQNTYLQEFNAKKALFGPGARKVSMKFRTVFDPRTGQQVQVPAEGKGGKEDMSTQKNYEDMNMFERMKSNRQTKRMMKEDERRFKGAKGSSTNDEEDFIKQAMEDEARREKKWGVQKAIPENDTRQTYTPRDVFGTLSPNLLTGPLDQNKLMMESLNKSQAQRQALRDPLAHLDDTRQAYAPRNVFGTLAPNLSTGPLDQNKLMMQSLNRQRYGGMYQVGGIQELTEDEIQQIMEAGGSVTYLD